MEIEETAEAPWRRERRSAVYGVAAAPPGPEDSKDERSSKLGGGREAGYAHLRATATEDLMS